MIYLDALENFSEEFLKWWKYFEPYVIDFVIIVLILFLIRKLSKPITNMIKKGCAKANIDAGVTSFFCSVTRFVIALVGALIILSVVGVSSATIATAIASCSLAVGLALQGTLQNFAGGVLILILKPFVAGDYIIVDKYEGIVSSIEICYTRIKTYDNQVIVLPNGALANTNLVNVFKEPYRRVDVQLPVSYSDDVKAVRNMVQDIMVEDELILNSMPQEVILTSFGDSNQNLTVRAWCKSENYWVVKGNLMEKIKEGIDKNGFSIPFNQVDVFIKK